MSDYTGYSVTVALTLPHFSNCAYDAEALSTSRNYDTGRFGDSDRNCWALSQSCNNRLLRAVLDYTNSWLFAWSCRFDHWWSRSLLQRHLARHRRMVPSRQGLVLDARDDLQRTLTARRHRRSNNRSNHRWSRRIDLLGSDSVLPDEDSCESLLRKGW